MGSYAKAYSPDQLAQYPDFLSDWQKVQQQQAVEGSSMLEESKKGFSRGVTGMEASAAGLGALGADVLGFQGAKTSLLDIYKRKQQQAATEEAPSVPTIQQALTGGPRALGQYVTGKAGELIPNVGEALTFAAAGTLAAPGPGTEAGAAAGFFGRIAARSALKKIVEGTLDAAGKKELEEFAAGKVLDTALSEPVAKVVKQAAGHLASIGASAANFAALGAGGSFGELSGTEGVTPEGARTGAAIAGAGASIGALIPERIIKSLFGEKAAADAVRTWIDSKAVTVPKELLVAGGGMGAMEFFSILGERYADPKKRDTDFTKEEYSRMLNAVATGVLAGAPAAGLTAMRGGIGKGWLPTPTEETTQAPPPPAGSEGAAPPPAAPEPGEFAAPSVSPPAPPRVDPVMESRRLLLEAQRKASTEIVQSDVRKARAAVTVPETPEEERMTVTGEIRKNEARTIREIQELFPKSELSREQARELRDAAWGKADKLTAENYGQITQEQRLVLLEIANKEVAGNLTDADRNYVQQLSAGQREQYKLIREGVEDATIIRGKKQGDVLSERVGNDAQLQETAQDREHAAKDQEKGDANSPGSRLQQAAGELDPAKKEALRSIGIDPDTLTVGARTAEEVPTGTETPVDTAVAKARAKALSEKPAAERKVPVEKVPAATEPIAPKAAPVPVEAGAAALAPGELGRLREQLKRHSPGTPEYRVLTDALNRMEARQAPWLASVPEAYNAWHVPVEGKEKTAFFGGMETDGNNKEQTNSLGVFETPSGRIAVVTIKKTGRPRTERVQISSKEAKSWDDAVKAGWKPLGVIRTGDTKQGKVFHLYTKEEWAPIQAELQGRAERGRSAVVDVASTPAAVVVEAGLREEGGHPSDTPRGALTASDATRIHELVTEHVGGIPKSEDVREMVSDAIVTSPEIQARLRDIAGQKDVDAIARVLDRIFEVYERASESGETDPTKLQSQITRELAGISSAKSKSGSQPSPPPPSDLRASIPRVVSREPGSPEYREVAQHVVQRLSEDGIPVNVISGNAGALASEVARSIGSYDRASKTINWTLSDASRPNAQDMRVLFEEAAHALFDRESPEARDAILKAAGSLDRPDTAVMDTVKADIAHAYPDGIRPEVYREELAAGYLSHKLVNEGFNPIQARGIAQSVLRLLKDVYLKSLMWLQKTFLGPEYQNQDLALRYYQNRLESFLAGKNDIQSFIQAMGGPKATHSTESTWHDPINGDRALAQTFNSITGQLDTAPMAEDSVAAALFNAASEDIRFSNPSPAGAPVQPFVDPSTTILRRVAANNDVRDVRTKISEAAGVAAEKFRKAFGLSNRDKIAEIHQVRAQHLNAQNVNFNARISDLSNPESIKDAALQTVKVLNSEMAKVGTVAAKAKDTVTFLEANIPEMTRRAERELDQYKDAQFMGDVIEAGVKKLTIQGIKREIQTSRALATVTQIYKELTGRMDQPVGPGYINALKNLFTGTELQGESLFNLMDRMANDPGIDFTKTPTAIREAIRTAAASAPIPDYQKLIQETPESKALLSSVIAYGKANQRVLTNLEARRMSSGVDRAELEQKVKDLWKETTAQIVTGVRRVAKSAQLEERMKIGYRDALRNVLTAKKNQENLEAKIAMGDAAVKVYKEALDKLTSTVKQAFPAQYQDQMVLRVPKDATQVRPSEFDEITVNLNANRGPVTDIRPIAEKLATWIKVRQEAAKNGDATALNADYQSAHQQYLSLFNNRFWNFAVRNTEHLTTGLVLGDAATQLDAIGTPQARALATMFRKKHALETTMRTQADNEFGYKNERLKMKALGVLNEGQSWYKQKKVDSGWFDTYIRNAAKDFLGKMQWTEGEQGRQSELDRNYGKLAAWLMAQPHIRPLIQDRMPQFMASLRDYLEAEHAASQWYFHKLESAGVLIKDPSLKVGGVEQLRTGIQTGIRTFHRSFAPTFSKMVEGLTFSGWANATDDFKRFKELAETDPNAAAQMVSKYFDQAEHSDTVRNNFLFELTHVPDESVFTTPAIDEAGTTLDANPMTVSRAYDETNGEVIPMLQRLYELQGGTGDVNQYIQDQLLVLDKQYHAAHAALEKVSPKGSAATATFQGMIPNALIDARQFPHWPGSWFDYPDFNPNENARMAERVAGEMVYGRDTSDFAKTYDVVVTESNAFVSKLGVVLEEAKRFVPSGRAKEIDKAAAKLLETDKLPGLQGFKTGKERLEFLRKQESRAPLLRQFLHDYTDYYRRGSDQLANLRWGMRFASFLSGLLVNNPASAISQMATTMDIPAQWGASPMMLEASRQTIKFTAKDIAGGLAQGIGWEFTKLHPYEQRFLDLKLNDPEAARRFGDIFAVQEGEQNNPASRAFRIARDVQSFAVNPKGPGAEFTPARPLAPFFQSVQNANRGLTIGLWNLTDKLVMKAVDYLRSHPGTDEVTADMLKLKGLDRDSFEVWRADAAGFGFNFTETAKAALGRIETGDKTVLSNDDLMRIYALGLAKVSLEPGPTTMSLKAYNNNVIRFALPLLGWSWRRALQVGAKIGGLDANDQRSLKAVRNAFLGFAATGLGGLALSLAVDAYQEDVVGKKRNIRALRFPTTGADWMAIQERLNRIGTFGLWGELINSGVNVGTGQGDNRLLSVDQRVVALQSFQGVLQAASAFINQGFDADYQHVVRPLVSSLGGGGMLQYLQVANHAFDLDNVENRVVKRINAENYLRVTGRDLGLSIRAGRGGYNTPTPITPWIARMEYAAYANDPAEFRDVYRSAVEEAKAAGKADPADYVKKAFETRHPLRYVFAQTPSEREYREVLGNMNDQGREAVTEAVRLFNYYGAHLGLTPFDGSKKKDQPKTNASERARAMAITY